ncbi:MAG: insulinase family protein [Ruminococcaceae bacterium]|nr:insulinase family protein [Oscillospiraceae bacterium]
MQIKEVFSEKLNERYFEIEHSTGLKICVWPKEGYNSTYAVFGTPFGSIYNHFTAGDKEIKVPDGIAHFLEHKLFESEEGDAFSLYASTGANANAYTSFDKTCYLFSCTDNFTRCLEILLGFVTSPYFTEETVQKEQGIIGQEIRMYDDSPEWRVMFNMLRAMYKEHPVKIDIAGTVETIAQITPEHLYACYNAYYNLHNMALTIVGKVDVEEVLEICDRCLKPCEKVQVKSHFPTDPYEVSEHYVEDKLPVAVPIFNLGFKSDASRRLTEKEIAYTDILLFLLASSISPLYRDLMDSGLINASFSYEQFEGPGYNSIFFSGESKDPKKVEAVIKEYIINLREKGITPEEFENARRATYGDALSSLNSVDTTANLTEDFIFCGRNLFGYFDAVANATIEDVQKRLECILDTENTTLSVIVGE